MEAVRQTGARKALQATEFPRILKIVGAEKLQHPIKLAFQLRLIKTSSA
jgi:hypothetical protein